VKEILEVVTVAFRAMHIGHGRGKIVLSTGVF